MVPWLGLLLWLRLVLHRQSAPPPATPAPAPRRWRRSPWSWASPSTRPGSRRRDLERSRDLILALLDSLPPGSLMMMASFSGDKRIVLPPTADRSQVASALARFKPSQSGRGSARRSLRHRRVPRRPGGKEARPSARVCRTREGGRSAVRGSPQRGDRPAHSHLRPRSRVRGTGNSSGAWRRSPAGNTCASRSPMPRCWRTRSSRARPAASRAPRKRRRPNRRPLLRQGGSAGLLGAAAVLFSLGGLLMLDHRGPAGPAPVRSRPGAPARSPRSRRSPIRWPGAPDGQEPSPPSTKTKPCLEQTLVVDAHPTLRALSGPGAGKNFAAFAFRHDLDRPVASK